MFGELFTLFCLLIYVQVACQEQFSSKFFSSLFRSQLGSLNIISLLNLQEAIERRDAAATVAASALQEAMLTESVVRNLRY